MSERRHRETASLIEQVAGRGAPPRGPPGVARGRAPGRPAGHPGPPAARPPRCAPSPRRCSRCSPPRAARSWCRSGPSSRLLVAERIPGPGGGPGRAPPLRRRRRPACSSPTPSAPPTTRPRSSPRFVARFLIHDALPAAATSTAAPEVTPMSITATVDGEQVRWKDRQALPLAARPGRAAPALRCVPLGGAERAWRRLLVVRARSGSWSMIPLLDCGLRHRPLQPPRLGRRASCPEDRYYRWCTYLYLPLQYAGLVFACWIVTTRDLSLVGQLGLRPHRGHRGRRGHQHRPRAGPQEGARSSARWPRSPWPSPATGTSTSSTTGATTTGWPPRRTRPAPGWASRSGPSCPAPSSAASGRPGAWRPGGSPPRASGCGARTTTCSTPGP